MLSGKAKNLPVTAFEDQQAWADWLHTNHVSVVRSMDPARQKSVCQTLGILCRSGRGSALLWLDRRSEQEYDETSWLQKFTSRRRGSIWSKINREKAERLIGEGRMQTPGLAEVDLAKQDGRWDAAYDSPGSATVPKDFQAALKSSPQASSFFCTLNSRNRFAILFRIQTAKKPAIRVRRIEQFIRMLENHEKLYP